MARLCLRPHAWVLSLVAILGCREPSTSGSSPENDAPNQQDSGSADGRATSDDSADPATATALESQRENPICPADVDSWCCGEAKGTCEVSFQRLVGAPGCFDDCNVKVTGYLVVRPQIEFRLYDHPYQGNSGGWMLGLGLDVEAAADPAQIAVLDVHYNPPPVVEVRGRYHADMQHPTNIANGYIAVKTITPVAAIEGNP